jgi:hypothetical protein
LKKWTALASGTVPAVGRDRRALLVPGQPNVVLAHEPGDALARDHGNGHEPVCYRFLLD